MPKKLFGLIGYPLSHSFSKKYFTEKFAKERIPDAQYELFEIDHIEKLAEVTKENTLQGLNVTIPYKQQIIQHLDQLDPVAKRIGAVNTVLFKAGKKIGYNSDYYGFRDSLVPWIRPASVSKALILGTGGASRAVVCVLQDLGIEPVYVSRHSTQYAISYEELSKKSLNEYPLLINTTPLGMSPDTDSYPDIDYAQLTHRHFCYDLVYNPEVTAFMRKAKAQGAMTKNGLEMLYLQAEKSWEFWNQ